MMRRGNPPCFRFALAFRRVLRYNLTSPIQRSIDNDHNTYVRHHGGLGPCRSRLHHRRSLQRFRATRPRRRLHHRHRVIQAGVRAITDAEIAAFKAKLAAAGVEASSVGPVYMDTEDQCRAAFEFTKRMGLKTLVAVPFEFSDAARKHRVASRKLCEYAAKCCKEFDIRYAIHNHGPDSPDYFPTGRSAYEMVADLDPRMGLCLDIGHDFRFGYDPVDSIRRYHDRLFALHLKNVVPDVVDKATGKMLKRNQARQFPRGDMDLVAIAQALKDVGFTGTCEIEYERDFTSNLTAMAENIGYFRGVMDSLR